MLEKRKNKKHEIEVKLQAVELYKQGLGAKRISTKLSIGKSIIERWLNQYEVKGIAGLQTRQKKRASLEIKQEVVKQVLEHGLSYDAVSLLFPVSPTSVYSWVSKVKKYGYSSLSEVTHKERPPKQMGRPKNKIPETELEKLQSEVEYLRAENAYLKKLRALVEEREARKSGKKPKPSNH
jgi:transposase